MSYLSFCPTWFIILTKLPSNPIHFLTAKSGFQDTFVLLVYSRSAEELISTPLSEFLTHLISLPLNDYKDGYRRSS
jgi:hypothetical protein